MVDNTAGGAAPVINNEVIALNIPGVSTPLTLCVHGEQDQFVSRRIREEGIWEPYETSLVVASLQSGNVFVDIGANIGYFSILAASIVGASGAVYAFEPDPENCRLLRASAELNGYTQIIAVEEAGLAAEARAGALFLSEDNLGDHQIYAAGEARSSVPIRLLQGSEFLAPLVQHIDLVKIDTQGSEFQVIAGLMPLLRSLPEAPRMIIELTPYSLREAGASGRALIELLTLLQQPFWIVDHIEHRLVASSADDLALWCDNVDGVDGDRGFMNILVGSAP